MRRSSRLSRHPRVHVVVYFLAREYLVLAGCLAVWAGAPLIFGWHAVTITSGSMSPHIRTGDVLVYEPVGTHEIVRGQVAVAYDPARPASLLSHRIVAVSADGTLTTRGDANRGNDSTPMPQENVQGIGRLRVPYLALPLIWLRQGHWPWGAGVLGGTVLMGLVVTGGRPVLMPTPRRFFGLGPLRAVPRPGEPTPAPTPSEPRSPAPREVPLASPTAAAVRVRPTTRRNLLLLLTMLPVLVLLRKGRRRRGR